MTTWIVPAIVDHVHDGDTVVLIGDLGWNIKLKMAVRVDGLASPELSTAAGKTARNYAVKLLPPGMKVTVVSKKLLGSTEKYGRVLASVSLAPDAQGLTVDFATAMIAAGQGVPWDGSGKQPTA